MKTLTVFLCLVLIAFSLKSQSEFSKVDNAARQIKKFSGVADLAARLSKCGRTDREKARAIYFWITENIAYDTKEYHSDSTLSVFTSIRNALADKAADKYDSLYDAALVDSVLKRKAGICEGYSVLFSQLCDRAGIINRRIRGMGKNATSQIGKYISNHAWNAVSINDKWFLIDACWGAGYCDTATRVFSKQRDDFYFMPHPRKFSYNHYPDHSKDLCYDNPISKQQFINLPLVFSDLFKKGFDTFLPLNGTVKKNAKNIYTIVLIKESNGNVPPSSEYNLKLKKTEQRMYFDNENDPSLTEMSVFYKGEIILKYKLQ